CRVRIEGRGASGARLKDEPGRDAPSDEEQRPAAHRCSGLRPLLSSGRLREEPPTRRHTRHLGSYPPLRAKQTASPRKAGSPAHEEPSARVTPLRETRSV